MCIDESTIFISKEGSLARFARYYSVMLRKSYLFLYDKRIFNIIQFGEKTRASVSVARLNPR